MENKTQDLTMREMTIWEIGFTFGIISYFDLIEMGLESKQIKEELLKSESMLKYIPSLKVALERIYGKNGK